MKVLVVQPDGTRCVKDISTLKGLQDEVGGWIELIAGPGWSAYLNEEGKLDGLPINTFATALAKTLRWTSYDILVGPVVFVGPTDSRGNDTDVPGFVLDAAGIAV